MRQSDIQIGRFFEKKSGYVARLVLDVYRTDGPWMVAYHDPYGMGVCQRGVFANWAGREVDRPSDWPKEPERTYQGMAYALYHATLTRETAP